MRSPTVIAESISLSVNRIDTWLHMLGKMADADGGDVESSTLEVHMHSARQFIEAAQNDIDKLLHALMDAERVADIAVRPVSPRGRRVRPQRKAVRRG